MRGIKRFAAFLFYGGVAAGVNIGTRWLLSHWLAYWLAVTLAFCAGLFCGFLLFKLFVFQKPSRQNIAREAAWYIGVNMLALLQTLAISLGLAEYLFPFAGMTYHPYDVAHMAGVLVPTLTSYLGHKYVTFK